ncbi:hypothetical protein CYLTODRAFT_350093 [Cylindrobasidium torrendii FP15055 ss-10]|uniref:F-box domain-containing protein n=1 Tax=Cylindrobasidium torrendii FP15055 ss-10 TaxID=1314674 RepID=A0A0D7BGA2_9AGAR|nr:hypothetical protein CYLTODRAFT_350093 [Cylindrobasidium torrendii FP15055 ss-10]
MAPPEPFILRSSSATRYLLEVIAETSHGKRTLARLARTCKALKEPCLDVLWREMDSIVPLVGLFPDDILKKARRPGLGLAKNPVDADWARVLKYGERVRKITYNESAGNIAASVFPVMTDRRPRTYILPKLRELVWKVDTAAGLERCFLFVNPELRSLHLEVGARMNVNAFLADMSTRTLSLKNFTFTSVGPLPEAFTELMRPQKALRSISLVAPGTLAPGVGRWAGTLPHLKSLQLDLTGRGIVAVESFFEELHATSRSSTPDTIDSGVFSASGEEEPDFRKVALRATSDGGRTRAVFPWNSLEEVHLTGDVSNVCIFIKNIACDLRVIDMTIEDPPNAADWQDLSAMISERFSDSLEVLRIAGTTTSRYVDLAKSAGRNNIPSRRLSLEYFSGLPKLIKLDLDLPESYIFLKADIKHLATICPAVQDIRLCPMARFPANGGPPRLTLEDVIPLLSGCPQLRSLAVVVNATNGSSRILNSPHVSSASLQHLHVGHSWVADSLQVTILLSHMAPHLDTLKWFREKTRPGYSDAHSRRWESITHTLPHIQGIRLAERRFAKGLLDSLAVMPGIFEEQEVDATVELAEEGVQAEPVYEEISVQFSPVLVDAAVETTTEWVDTAVNAVPEVVEVSVGAVPMTMSQTVDATVVSVTKSVQALLDARPDAFRVRSRLPSIPSIPRPLEVVSLAWRVAIFFPVTLPLRVLGTVVDKVTGAPKETPYDLQPEWTTEGKLVNMDGTEVQADAKPEGPSPVRV